MNQEFSTLKISNLYFPKLRVIRAKKYKKLNLFLKRNESNNNNIYFSSKKIKTNNNVINSIKINSPIYPKTPPNAFTTRIKSPHTINKYTFKKDSDVKKEEKKMNRIFMEFYHKKKNNTKLRNQGITTCDSFFVRKSSKINHRILTLGKNENNLDNLSTLNNNTMREVFINKYDKIIKHKFPLSGKIPLKIINDKYAYIYMSDKSELIKHWRRTNYNPLNI